MEFRSNQPSPNHNYPDSSPYRTEPWLRVGYTAQEMAHTQYEHLVAAFHYAREAINIEIEKELTKEQILMEEIAKKRVLEAGVRGEIMLLEAELARVRATRGALLGLPTRPGTMADGSILEERVGLTAEGLELRSQIEGFETLPLQRGSIGLPTLPEQMELQRLGTTERMERQDLRSESRAFGTLTFQRGSHLLPAVSQPVEFSRCETRPGGRRIEETVALTSDKRESRGVESSPVHGGTIGLRISEVIPGTEKGKETKEIILLPTPEPICVGSKSVSKRKAANTSKRPQEGGSSKKKAKVEWSCGLCQVISTSESDLQRHLEGNKHKTKVAPIRNSKPGKNCSIKILPKLGAEEMASDKLPPKKTEEKSSSKSLIEPMLGNSSKKPEETTRIVQENDKKTKFKFWCELCQVSTATQQIMENHKQGRKHNKIEAASIRNFLPKPSTENMASDKLPPKKIGKKSSSMCLIEPMFENSNKEPEEAAQIVQENDKKTKSKFWCELCLVGTPSEEIMESHKRGKKHMKFLKVSEKKGESGPFNQVWKITAPLFSEDGNSSTAEHGNKVSPKAGLENHESPNENTVGKDGKDSELTTPIVADKPKAGGVDENELIDANTCNTVSLEDDKRRA